MVQKILNNTTPYGKIRASHEGSLHSSTLIKTLIIPTVIILQLSDKFKSLTFKIVQPKGNQ